MRTHYGREQGLSSRILREQVSPVMDIISETVSQ